MVRSLIGWALALGSLLGPFATSAVALTNDLVFKNSFESTWIAGYHVGYQRFTLPTADINFNDITHLMVGAIVPHTDGSLDTSFFIDNVNGPLWAQGAIDAAHAHGRKAILMIGGAGAIDGWRGAASNTNLNAFVTNLSNAANAYGAEGLDIDWEPITDNNLSNVQIAADHAELAAFVQAMRTARPDLLLTMPVGAYNPNYPPAVSEQTLFTTVKPLLNQINLMSYDMIYAGFGWDSWFSSALVSDDGAAPLAISSSIAYYEGLGVPAGELGVGAGFFGACYANVTGPRQPTGQFDIISDADNYMSYIYIHDTYLPATTYHYDTPANAPWLSPIAPATTVGPDNCTYLTYEDEASILAKGAWVKANGLGGTIIWTIGEGHLGSGNDPLLDAVRTAFP